ncbi:DNA replication complex GINS protein, partial [Acrasis kona]
MYGEKAIEVLKDLKHNESVPIYNQVGVTSVMQEMDLLYLTILKINNSEELDQSDPAIATNVITHYSGFMRNKRCILAYLYERIQRIKRLRWECGVTLPTNIEPNLHQTEKGFFDKYDKLLGDYGAEVNFDLTSDSKPPKDAFIEIRIIKTEGEDDIVLEDRTIKLKKNHIYYMNRSDAEMLINRGLAVQINSR